MQKRKKDKPPVNFLQQLSEGIGSPLDEMDEPTDRINPPKGAKINPDADNKKRASKNLTARQGKRIKGNNYFDKMNPDILPWKTEDKILSGKEEENNKTTDPRQRHNPNDTKYRQKIEDRQQKANNADIGKGAWWNNPDNINKGKEFIQADQQAVDEFNTYAKTRGVDPSKGKINASGEEQPGWISDNGDIDTARLMWNYHDLMGSAPPEKAGIPSMEEIENMQPEKVKQIQQELSEKGYNLGDYGTVREDGTFVGDDGIAGEYFINALRSHGNENVKPVEKMNPVQERAKRIKEDPKKRNRNPVPDLFAEEPPQKDREKEDRIKNAGKWSAIGSALRNVIDAAGGSQGADIWNHQYSPLQTVTNNLSQLQSQYAEDMNEYQKRQQEANMLKQKQRFADTQRRSQNQFDTRLTQMIEGYKDSRLAKEAQIDVEKRKELDKWKTANKKNYAKYKSQLDANLDNVRTSNDMKAALAKASMDAATASDEDGYFQVTRGNGEQVDIPEGTYYDIINRIMKDVNSGDLTDDPDLSDDTSVLNLALEGKGSKNALNIKVAQYWDKYYKQDQKTGNVVSKDYAKEQDQQFSQNLMSEVEQDIQQSKENPQQAIKSIAATLIANGSYESSSKGAQAAMKHAQQLYEQMQGKQNRTPTQQEAVNQNYKDYPSGGTK